MRTATWGGVWMLAMTGASCTSAHEPDDRAPIGAPCARDSECVSEVCEGPVGEARCATVCEGEVCGCPDDVPVREPNQRAVDLLLMIENGGGMAEEQESLLAELPQLVQTLMSWDLDDDGIADLGRGLHVGVVSSDMGAGGHPVPTCGTGTFGAARGDDGLLLTRGSTSIEGCMATYPAVFELGRDVRDHEELLNELSCVVRTGTDGCGFEQPLDAVLKALSPAVPTDWTAVAYLPPVFVENTDGHADYANAGFVRADSVLAIVMLSEEDDCSALDPDLFDVGNPAYADSDLGLRCFAYPEALHPIERYVHGIPGLSTGLLGMRRDPSQLVFGLIAGIPVDIEPAAGTTIDYEAILAHPDMLDVIDPSMPTRLRPSCNTPGRGISFPPNRMVRVAQGLEAGGAQVALGSICQESYGVFTTSLIDALAESLSTPVCD